MYPMKLSPAIAEIVWGGTRLIEEYGMVTDKKNAAEAWVLSCHPSGLCKILNGAWAGRTLAELFSAAPSICGTRLGEREDFPILIKFIDARDDLSVQVHPDDAYTKFIGRGAGKTEAWYILDCDEGAQLVLGFKRELTRHEFIDAIENDRLPDVVQRVDVKKGDFFFIEAGTLHAICKGVLLAEVQQNSDTTYRVYDYNRPGLDGKPRELHVLNAIDVTATVPYRAESGERKREHCGGAERETLTVCPFFTVNTLTMSGSCAFFAGEESFISLLVLEGEGALNAEGMTLSLHKGESVFIPAGCGDITLTGTMTLLETRL